MADHKEEEGAEEALLPGLEQLDLLNDNLSDEQLECFELVCERGLNIKDTKDDQGRIIFHALYLKLPQDYAPSLLRLFLDRLRYSTRNEAIKMNILKKLPVMKKSDKEEMYRQYPKLDMWLTLSVAMMSLSTSGVLCKSDYQVLEDYHRRHTLNSLLARDRITSPFHLLKLIDAQSQFDPDDLSNVLKWFRDCGLNYPKEIYSYQKRHRIGVPIHWEIRCKRTFYSSFCLSIFTVPASICILLFLTIPNYPLVTNNVTSEDIFVGGKATTKIGEFSSKLYKDLQIEALNDTNGHNYANGTVIHTVKKNDFNVSFKELDFESLTYTKLGDEVPVFLEFNKSVPLYNADGESVVNLSFNLTNTNGTGCAARLVILTSQLDFDNYSQSNQDPRDIPLNAYNYTECLNRSGTFSVNMKRDVYSFFAIAHVRNINLTVNTSGHVSKYVTLDQESSCILSPSCHRNIIISDEECTNDGDDSTDDERLYIFATSMSRFLGKVNVTEHYLCNKEYNYWYFAAGAVSGVVSLILLFVCGLSCSVCLYKCIFRAREMKVV